MDILKQKIQTIKGIGPKKAQLLKKMGIETLEDALYSFPRDYEEQGPAIPVSSIRREQLVSLAVEFQGKPEIIRPRKRMSIIRWRAIDSSGTVVCVWYNQLYRINQYKEGITYFVHGKADLRYGAIQIQNPEIKEYNAEEHDKPRILPIYSVTDGINQKDMRNILSESMERIDGQLKDEMPPSIRKKFGLVEKNYALTNIHFPCSRQAMEWARRRLVFEELFFLQMALYFIRNKYKDEHRGIIFEWDHKAIQDFIDKLPFPLTLAQQRVIKEILQDLKKNNPMNRLIYGDVGSGKTIIAAVALYVACMSGFQGVLMAPTEILARQHGQSLSSLFKGTGVRIDILVGGVKEKDKQRLKRELLEGKINIIIGTHAILQEDVSFQRLGLVITDEQHRFGVRQRAILTEKGSTPHILVMSATPIPRTLALILYGDLDISIIDQLPPGRKPIKTYHVTSSMLDRVYNFINKQAENGYQTYLVCPLIEESDTLSLKSATDLYNELKSGVFAHLTLGLLHGKMSAKDKEEIMAQFVAREIDVLVSTTVIEVGVNVGNANLMVIQNAERFGLAQLHQLRGRVGRSHSQSYCILVADAKGQIARERMNIMVNSTNGFEISEKDLELRGPGDFFGIRQHGLPEFKIANLLRDINILKEAQDAAEWVMKDETCNERDVLFNIASNKFYKIIEKIAMN